MLLYYIVQKAESKGTFKLKGNFFKIIIIFAFVKVRINAQFKAVHRVYFLSIATSFVVRWEFFLVPSIFGPIQTGLAKY